MNMNSAAPIRTASASFVDAERLDADLGSAIWWRLNSCRETVGVLRSRTSLSFIAARAVRTLSLLMTLPLSVARQLDGTP
jgi:hypothetical protein